MRTRTAALLVALAVAGGTAEAGGGGKIKWGSSHGRALAEAKESGKPVVIYFYGDG